MKPGPDAAPGKRILVTGSRGKSSVVRLLQAAMADAGLESYARVTGVVPREIGPDGTRTISRSSGAHVEEMRWWLKRLPRSAQAVILENSAITPELQGLAGCWLQPDITILTNTLPDHQEAWGPTRACAAGVIAQGIPGNARLVLPAALEADGHLLDLLQARHCRLLFAGSACGTGEDHRAANLGLAVCALQHLGFETEAALKAMLAVRPDRHDFRVASYDGAEVAMAFSVNDIASTKELFRSLAWREEETRLIYNHRADRPGRLRSFVDWLNQSPWREVLIIGDRPVARVAAARYLKLKSARGLLRLFRPGDRIFGCGNIAGLPLSLSRINQPWKERLQ